MIRRLYRSKINPDSEKTLPWLSHSESLFIYCNDQRRSERYLESKRKTMDQTFSMTVYGKCCTNIVRQNMASGSLDMTPYPSPGMAFRSTGYGYEYFERIAKELYALYNARYQTVYQAWRRSRTSSDTHSVQPYLSHAAT
jgi:hypothetical protein